MVRPLSTSGSVPLSGAASAHLAAAGAGGTDGGLRATFGSCPWRRVCGRLTRRTRLLAYTLNTTRMPTARNSDCQFCSDSNQNWADRNTNPGTDTVCRRRDLLGLERMSPGDDAGERQREEGEEGDG